MSPARRLVVLGHVALDPRLFRSCSLDDAVPARCAIPAMAEAMPIKMHRAKVAARFGPQMAQALPPPKLAQAWAGVLADAGAFGKIVT